MYANNEASMKAGRKIGKREEDNNDKEEKRAEGEDEMRGDKKGEASKGTNNKKRHGEERTYEDE